MTRFTVGFPALVLAACAFEPSGDGAVDPDADPVIDGAVVDGSPDLDAAAIDARVIDARVIDAPNPACPVGYDVVAGASRFRFVTNNQPFGNATADCGNDGANTHIATFEVAADMQVAMAGRGGSEEFWVAAECTTLGGECDQTASWQWEPSNDPVDPALWAKGQPSSTTSDRNAIAFKESSNWRLDNIAGNTVQAYVCECGD